VCVAVCCSQYKSCSARASDEYTVALVLERFLFVLQSVAVCVVLQCVLQCVAVNINVAVHAPIRAAVRRSVCCVAVCVVMCIEVSCIQYACCSVRCVAVCVVMCVVMCVETSCIQCACCSARASDIHTAKKKRCSKAKRERTAKMLRMPYLSRSFSAKEPCN